MARLYSDLADGTGRRYYFGLASAPGGITNAEPARLTLTGRPATAQEQNTAFRSPATAALTLNGLSVAAEPHLQPATAALSIQGLVSGLATLKVITNALPPDYTDLPENLPTALTIMTVSPTKATLTLSYPPVNLTQGGNIGFIFPDKATLTLAGYIANFPRVSDVGLLSISGRIPTLLSEIVVSPEPALLSVGGFAALLSLPFVWVDEDPQPATIWIDDPPA
jgi:hypothetical protein